MRCHLPALWDLLAFQAAADFYRTSGGLEAGVIRSGGRCASAYAREKITTHPTRMEVDLGPLRWQQQWTTAMMFA